MNWQNLADIATVSQAVVVVATLIFLGIQMRQQTQLARWASSQAMVEQSNPICLEFLRDEKLSHLWVSGWQEYDGYNDAQKYQYDIMLIMHLNLYENFYYQWRRRLMDRHLWRACEADIVDFVCTQHLELRWGDLKSVFDDEFRCYIEGIIKRTAVARSVQVST